MRINFVLPRSTNTPIGGYKIVLQYADFLTTKYSDDVHVYFVINAKKWSVQGLRAKISGLTWKRRIYRQIDWITVSSNVKMHFDVFPEDIEKFDDAEFGKVIATHWSTAEIVANTKIPSKNKFYFIQHFEVFDPNATRDQVENTWKLGLHNIVIADWLKKIGDHLEVATSYVPNFVDIGESPIRSFESSFRNRVTILWHENPVKQTGLGLELLEKLHDLYPSLKMTVFGAHISGDLPKYVEAFSGLNTKQISEQILSQTLLYIMTSREEGWGLTAMEAMASGAPVISVDNGGINEFAENEKSALIVLNSFESLMLAADRVLGSVELQKRLSMEGNRVVQRFSLSASGSAFREALIGDLDEE